MRSEWVNSDCLHVVLMTLAPTNRLILEVCLSTGLRLSDVLNLRTEQLARRFTVRELKTGKKRRIYLNNDLLGRCFATAGKYFVFEHRINQHQHRTRQAVWHDIKRSATLLRVKPNLSPHSTRKAWAVSQVDKGKTLEDVQKMMNHTDIAVTVIYALADKVQANKF